MPHTVEKIEDAPIIVITYTDPYNIAIEGEPAIKEVTQLAESIDGKLFTIFDCTRVSLTFGDLTSGMQAQKVGTRGSISDPNATVILVGTSDLIQIARQAFSQEQYGGVDVPLFTDVDAAIAFAREAASSE